MNTFHTFSFFLKFHNKRNGKIPELRHIFCCLSFYVNHTLSLSLIIWMSFQITIQQYHVTLSLFFFFFSSIFKNDTWKINPTLPALLPAYAHWERVLSLSHSALNGMALYNNILFALMRIIAFNFAFFLLPFSMAHRSLWNRSSRLVNSADCCRYGAMICLLNRQRKPFWKCWNRMLASRIVAKRLFYI